MSTTPARRTVKYCAECGVNIDRWSYLCLDCTARARRDYTGQLRLTPEQKAERDLNRQIGERRVSAWPSVAKKRAEQPW